MAAILGSVGSGFDYESEPVVKGLALTYLNQNDEGAGKMDSAMTRQVLETAVRGLRRSLLLDDVLSMVACRPEKLAMIEQLPLWYDHPADLPSTRRTLRSLIYQDPEMARALGLAPVTITPEQRKSVANLLARIGPFDEQDEVPTLSSQFDDRFTHYVDTLFQTLTGGYRPDVDRILKFAEALPPSRREIVRRAATSIHHVAP